MPRMTVVAPRDHEEREEHGQWKPGRKLDENPAAGAIAEKEQAVSDEPREAPGYVHNPDAALDVGSHACPLRGRAMKLVRRSAL
jgi:hypothetical protein